MIKTTTMYKWFLLTWIVKRPNHNLYKGSLYLVSFSRIRPVFIRSLAISVVKIYVEQPATEGVRSRIASGIVHEYKNKAGFL